jgi:hypothetical protein
VVHFFPEDFRHRFTTTTSIKPLAGAVTNASKEQGREGPALVHPAVVILVITFASSVQVSGIRRCQVSGVRCQEQFEVIANFVDIEGIGENIGANDSRRKAAQAAVPKIGFI